MARAKAPRLGEPQGSHGMSLYASSHFKMGVQRGLRMNNLQSELDDGGVGN